MSFATAADLSVGCALLFRARVCRPHEVSQVLANILPAGECAVEQSGRCACASQLGCGEAATHQKICVEPCPNLYMETSNLPPNLSMSQFMQQAEQAGLTRLRQQLRSEGRARGRVKQTIVSELYDSAVLELRDFAKSAA